MTDCGNCGASLSGQQAVAFEDGPLDAGEKIPKGGPLYDEEVGYVLCPSCEDVRKFTPKQYYKQQFFGCLEEL